MTAEHSQDVVRTFEGHLGERAPLGREMLKMLQGEFLPFQALEAVEEETMRALVLRGYVAPDFWLHVYCIDDLGLSVVDAYKERQEI